MRKAIILRPMLLPILLVASCSDGSAPEESKEKADHDVAMVEAANRVEPPLHEIVPEAIGAPDMEKHDMAGEACAYAPGTSIGARVIAREGDAFVKVDGEVLRLAADSGSHELPAHSRSQYVGREFSLALAIHGAGKPVANSKAADYPGTIELRDSWGRVIYSAAGLARCGG